MAGETQPHGSVHTLPGGPARGDTTKRTGEVLPLPGQAPALPDRIGGYRVLRELGRGGMGVVYLAENLGLRRQVALKVLPGGADLEAVERFQLEARAAARVKHPNVVGVHEVGRDGERWFLAMDLVDGESLRARVQRDGPLEPREAARVVEAIARALHEAHTLGVLHRDVKPHNILLERDGTPLLADFGLARDTGQAGITVTGEVMGTPAYMAPEQAAGDRARVDRRADVYAAGATLYEALTGQPPFQGPTALHILAQVTADAPRPPSSLRPGLDRELETVVLKCLEKEPAARYDTAGELADDLGRWLRHEPLVARRPGPFARLVKLARRRPMAAAVTALGVTVGLAAAVAERAQAVERRRSEAVRARETEAVRGEALTALEVANLTSSVAERASAFRTALYEARRWMTVARDDPAAAARHLLAVAIAAGEAGRIAWPRLENEGYAFALKLSPDDPERKADLTAANDLVRAYELLDEGRDSEGACASAAAVTRLRPRWVEPWILLSRVQLETGDTRAALGSLDEAARLGAAPAVICYRRAFVLVELKDAPGALRELDRALELHRDWPEALRFRAETRIELGDGSGALADLGRLVALEPDSIRFLCERGDLRQRLGDLEGSDFLEVTRRAPDDARGWLGVSSARARAGLLPQARAAAERAVEVAPHLGTAWLGRGRVRLLMGDLEGALADLSEAVRLSPGDPQAALEFAGLLTSRDPARADEILTQTLARSGRGFVATLVRRGEARRRLRDFEGALRDANAAIALAPDYAEAWSLRGYTHANLERVPEAIADLERALRLAPAHLDAPALREALDMLRRNR
jgi:tetratricopeptide (TPR) repeat protein/predicted Ser/Thr protein kinase